MLFALLSFSALGQGEFDPQKSYNTFKMAAKVSSSFVFDFNPINYSMDGFSPAIILTTKRNNFHEFELTQFNISKGYDQYTYEKVKSSDVGLGYQFMWSLTKKSARWVPLLGFGSSVRFQSVETNSQFGSFYDRNYSLIIGSFGVVPQLRYFASEKFFFDLAIPLNCFDLSYGSKGTENPSIPVRQQKMDGFSVEFIPFSLLQVKIGAGVRI
jgi:hypothetical protein